MNIYYITRNKYLLYRKIIIFTMPQTINIHCITNNKYSLYHKQEILTLSHRINLHYITNNEYSNVRAGQCGERADLPMLGGRNDR